MRFLANEKKGKGGMVWKIFILYSYHGCGNLWCLAHLRQHLMFPRDHEMVELDMATRRSRNKTGQDTDLTQRCLDLPMEQPDSIYLALFFAFILKMHPKVS